VAVIRILIAYHLDLVAWAGASVKGICQYWQMDELALYHLELCVVEAVTNSVTHTQATVEQEIEIRLVRESNGIRIAIWDHGDPLPADLLERHRLNSDPTRESLLEISEHGRGLGLIQDLMTEVEFGRAANRNVLQFFYRWDGQ
jgi:serine/threonine-protein kinase RsbW